MPNATKVIVSGAKGEVGVGVLVDEQQIVIYTDVADSWRKDDPVTARIARDDEVEERPAVLDVDKGFVGATLDEPPSDPSREYVENPLPSTKVPEEELARYVAEWRRRADSDEPPFAPPGGGGIHGPVKWICRVIFRRC